MKKQVFIGGFYGSGTRVIQLILRKAGFFLGDRLISAHLDYIETENPVRAYLQNKEGSKKWFKNVIEEGTIENKPWSIKHGHLMFVIPMLKEIFPNSKFILVVRHGLDNILNQHRMDEQWGEYFIPNNTSDSIFERRMLFWNIIYKKAIEDGDKFKNDFLIIRLEDLVFDKIDTLNKLFNFLDIKIDDLSEYERLIEQPASIGRYRKSIIIKKEVYIPEFADKLYNIGEEMMEKFNYAQK